MTYDVIVIGTGGVGSAVTYHLAQRGARVLGLDQFTHAHDRGSSHGQTRIIRQAYHEHVNYVPLVLTSYNLWQDLEQQSGESLLHRTGLLGVGHPDGEVIRGIRYSASTHHLHVDEVTHADISLQYPGYRLPPDTVGLLEHEAVYLFVENCVMAHLQMAKKHGAELLTGEVVRGWQSDGQTVTVSTEKSDYSAANVVVTTGAWASRLLVELNIPLRVEAKHLHWYATDNPKMHTESGCPSFFFECPEGIFYGFPKIDERGVKVAEHTGGTPVENPDELDRSIDPVDRNRVERFLDTCLPGVRSQASDHAVCMYTRSPDDHFIVDRHPEWSNVAFAFGLSGHGFKFTPVLGSALADLSLNGSTDLPIQFLSCQRFSKT